MGAHEISAEGLNLLLRFASSKIQKMYQRYNLNNNIDIPERLLDQITPILNDPSHARFTKVEHPQVIEYLNGSFLDQQSDFDQPFLYCFHNMHRAEVTYLYYVNNSVILRIEDVRDDKDIKNHWFTQDGVTDEDTAKDFFIEI